MTDTNTPRPDEDPNSDKASGTGAGVRRPDESDVSQPSQATEGSASGGEGAAGAGGSDGFGTGT